MNGPVTILVADDDPNDRVILRRGFAKACQQHQLIEVPGGQEAIDYLAAIPPFSDRTRYPAPDLVLLDLKMPAVSGFDVLAWVHEHSEVKTMPIVVFSGSFLQSDKEKAIRLGADGYETKAHEFAALVQTVQGICSRWLPGTV